MKGVQIFACVMLLAIVILPPTEVTAYPSGLVSYWQFDENIGTTATDSVWTNAGTIDGASWDIGLVGGALRFDGVDDIVRLANVSGYGDFTMSAWFKPSTISQTQGIFQTGMGNFALQHVPEGGMTYVIHENREGGSGSQYDYRLDQYLSFADEWHFAVMTGTADNNVLRAYLDGQFLGSLEMVSLIGIMEPPMIGVIEPAGRAQNGSLRHGQFSFFHPLSQVQILGLCKGRFLRFWDCFWDSGNSSR